MKEHIEKIIKIGEVGTMLGIGLLITLIGYEMFCYQPATYPFYGNSFPNMYSTICFFITISFFWLFGLGVVLQTWVNKND